MDLFTDTDGKLYISRNGGKGIVMKDGQTILETGTSGYLSVHPSGAWGITSYLGYDTESNLPGRQRAYRALDLNLHE